MKPLGKSLLFPLLLASFAAAADLPVEQRVVVLPEIAAGKYYLTVVYDANWTPADRALQHALYNDHRLISLREQTVVNQWTSEFRILKETNWGEFIGGEYPAILLQAQADPNGQADVVFFARGQIDLKALPQHMQAHIDHYARREGPFEPLRRPCPDGRCPLSPIPRPFPQPQPAPQPADPVVPPPSVAPIVPSIGPPTVPPPDEGSPDQEGGIPLLALLLPLAAAGLGLWRGFDHE